VDNHAIIAVARRLQLEAAMVIIDGIALAAVAIALGRLGAGQDRSQSGRRIGSSRVAVGSLGATSLRLDLDP